MLSSRCGLILKFGRAARINSVPDNFRPSTSKNYMREMLRDRRSKCPEVEDVNRGRDLLTNLIAAESDDLDNRRFTTEDVLGS